MSICLSTVRRWLPLAVVSPGPVRGIVTPEAVVLDFETASVGSRALAQGVDIFVRLGLLFVLSFLIQIVFAIGGRTVAVVVAVIGGFLLLFGYPVFCEVRWNGKTVGKRALGLRVVTVEGAPVGIRHAAVRSMLAVVDFVLIPIGLVATVSVLLSRRNQRLGDLLAGTIVLREGSGAAFPVPVSFPPLPGYEGYARSLDVGGVTPEQYALLRSFLIRVNELTPAARAHLAARLAGPLASAMHHTVPPGVGNEAFLVSAAAAYQLRQGGPPVPLPPWLSPWGQPAGMGGTRAP
jgi:uncharacterized RDD family membrane protein YckC